MNQAREKISSVHGGQTADVLSYPGMLQRRAQLLLERMVAKDRQILEQMETLTCLLHRMADILPSEAVRTLASWVDLMRDKIGKTPAMSPDGIACRAEAMVGLNALQKALSSRPEKTPGAQAETAELLPFPGPSAESRSGLGIPIPSTNC